MSRQPANCRCSSAHTLVPGCSAKAIRASGSSARCSWCAASSVSRCHNFTLVGRFRHMTQTTVAPASLSAMLHDGEELALLDVREAGEFGEAHLLFATPLPYSRLELDIPALVPRKTARVVLCDGGQGGLAELAVRRLGAMGYT